jgi:lipopolysaccharide/colanic/teichoic acid biosynthesis glycosyltransferase
VAEDISSLMPSDEGLLVFEVYVYPSERWLSDDDSVSENDDRRQERSLEPLFERPLPGWKRALDVTGAVTGLVILSPAMLIAASAVKVTSPGPVLFSQLRTGAGGRKFRLYKFRSMCVEAEQLKAELRHRSEQDGPAFKLRGDPRVTPIGQFLRRTCVDELPQLWNVLKGDMSLVGPRPLPCDESRGCDGWHRRRLDITPGLTCTWQVGASRVSFAEWMRMDIRYSSRRHLVHDLTLLFKTFLRVVRFRASH